MNTFLSENLSGMKLTQIFNQEKTKDEQFGVKNNEVLHQRFNVIKAFGVYRPLISFIYNASIALCFYLGVRYQLSAGEIVAFYLYMSKFFNPIQNLAEQFNRLQSAFASGEKVFTIMDIVPDVVDSPDVKEPAPLKGDIEFKNVTFRHPGAEYDALTDVSFAIKAGEQVGIIGKTGAGKTTLVDLILRTYNVPDGTLFVDGYDVNRIPIRTVRQFAAYVPQDNFLFSDTIAHNIAFALGEADSETVQNAAKLADIHDNISEFTLGYETILGERGVTVSGGQKQRISIARALLKDAGLLILDDSVSAVDVKTEKVILENLRRERTGKTTILIAHRISTVESMDKIIFIDDGRVIAVGSHKTLCDTCPEYRRMVELQRLDDETTTHSSPVSMTKEVISHA